MSLWLFNIYKDCCMREIKKMEDLGPRLKMRYTAVLFADDNVLLTGNGWILQMTVINLEWYRGAAS